MTVPAASTASAAAARPNASYLPRPSSLTHRPSLRTRLVILSTVACLFAFILAGVILYFSIRDSLYHTFDEALTARATALSALVEQEGTKVHLQTDPSVTSAYTANQRRNYFEILGPDGTTLLRSPSLGDGHLVPPAALSIPHFPTHQDTTLPDGRPARTVSLRFVARPDEERPLPPGVQRLAATVLVATDTKRVEDNLFRFAKQLMIVCGIATLAVATALWLLITRQLRPVKDVAEQIARVGRADLSERLDPGPAPAELLPVVTRLNEMLARLSSAFEREKAFTADVAHELRTPISALEAAIEVSNSRLREPEAYRQTLGKCLRTVRDMHALVDRLLTLARADARQLTVRPAAVDLAPLIEDAWDTVTGVADRRNITIDLAVPPGTTIQTDPEILRLVVQNALDNAATYAAGGSAVTVRADQTPDGPSLSFTNPAPGMTSEQASRVFDRFWRADDARQAGHVGLGLPLCQKLMQSLGGDAAVSLVSPGLFRLTLRFPS